MIRLSFDMTAFACLIIAVVLAYEARRQRRANALAAWMASDSLRREMEALALRTQQLETLKKSMEPIESVERYAGRLRDANEVHRYREPILRGVAKAALILRAGALVQSDDGHPTVHVKPGDFAALVLALKPYMALHEDGADPGAVDKVSALGAVGGDDSGEGDDAA